MPWVKIDDHFDEHPKLARVGPPAWGYWLAGLAYCNRNLTDGFIPYSVAYNLAGWDVWDDPDADGREQIWHYSVTSGMGGEEITGEWIVDRLLSVGLWTQCTGGFRVHDFLEYNPSKAAVLAERKAWAAKKASQRESPRESPVESPRESGPRPDRPVPVPVPVPKPVPSPGPAATPSKDGSNGEKSLDELGVARPLPISAIGFHPVPKPMPRRKP